MSASRPSFYRRITASVPLLVTVLVHVVLIAIAGYFVVSEQLIGKKKSFDAAPVADNVAQKQVEHRLQVARKGGGSASASPVSASRIFSTAKNALQMPAMPDLPSVGASSLSGMGFGAGMGAVGTGTGYNTGGGSSTLGGSGFMSMSFLGTTSQRVSKVVFVVDVGPGVMDIRKGGFRAFEIMRTEMSRLVSGIPPAGQFNVILFSNDQIRLFMSGLQPATVANKTAFFDWIKPLNVDMDSLGTSRVSASSPSWKYAPAEKLKLDPGYRPASWINALHAALEQEPDTVFLITGSAWPGNREASQAQLNRSYEAYKKYVADLVRQGYDLPAIAAARNKALTKLREDFEAINRKLVEQKRDPFVIQDIKRVLAPDFQAAIKKAGFTLKLDSTGWTDKAGGLLWDTPASDKVGPRPVTDFINTEFADALLHVSKLQYGLLRARASVNIFLFTGPDEQNQAAEKNLSTLSSKNGGKFSLLTSKRLEEIAAKTP